MLRERLVPNSCIERYSVSRGLNYPFPTRITVQAHPCRRGSLSSNGMSPCRIPSIVAVGAHSDRTAAIWPTTVSSHDRSAPRDREKGPFDHQYFSCLYVAQMSSILSYALFFCLLLSGLCTIQQHARFLRPHTSGPLQQPLIRSPTRTKRS